MIVETFILLADVLEIIAVVLIIWGALVVALRLTVSEWHHVRGKGDRVRFEQIRVDFGQRIVLAIEFMVAADLVMTILDPAFEEIIRLGMIVLIRTVLSYFLTREVDRHEKEWKR